MRRNVVSYTLFSYFVACFSIRSSFFYISFASRLFFYFSPSFRACLPRTAFPLGFPPIGHSPRLSSSQPCFFLFMARLGRGRCDMYVFPLCAFVRGGPGQQALWSRVCMRHPPFVSDGSIFFRLFSRLRCCTVVGFVSIRQAFCFASSIDGFCQDCSRALPWRSG